jgi:hypothetical protein
VRDASASSLVGFLGQNVLRPALVATDGWSGSRGLEAKGYAHQARWGKLQGFGGVEGVSSAFRRAAWQPEKPISTLR